MTNHRFRYVQEDTVIQGTRSDFEGVLRALDRGHFFYQSWFGSGCGAVITVRRDNELVQLSRELSRKEIPVFDFNPEIVPGIFLSLNDFRAITQQLFQAHEDLMHAYSVPSITL